MTDPTIRDEAEAAYGRAVASIRAAFDRAADDLVEEWQNGPMEITERDRRMGGLKSRRDAAIRAAKSAFYAAQGHHIPPPAFA